MPARTRVGVLGSGALAEVDEHGTVHGDGLTVGWWIGADDRWHVPDEETTTRRRRPTPAPVVETVVRVPGGEAAHLAYGAAVDGGAVTVIEIENRSPAPFTATLVVTIARAASVVLDHNALLVDGAVVMLLPRPPGAWAAGASTRAVVTSGAASRGPFEPQRGPLEVAFLFPVAHRTTLRAVLSAARIDVLAPADAGAVARGWERQLERGMQAQVPLPVGAGVDPARADLLLAVRTDPAVVAALEDWGNDSEAADGWARLGWAGRRRARRRIAKPDSWVALLAIDPQAEPARFLSALRGVLVRERPGGIDLVPGFPPDWLGQSITVDAVPLRNGPLSFAVRWHGDRPALLWEAPAGIELRIAALDPTWSSSTASGEVLLAAPPTSLLAMGAGDRSAGKRVDAPGQFS